jgi:hypothetical protein
MAKNKQSRKAKKMEKSDSQKDQGFLSEHGKPYPLSERSPRVVAGGKSELPPYQ